MGRYIEKLNIEILFILLQTILYATFLVLDLTGGSSGLSNKVKYSIIILCFCYTLFRENTASGKMRPYLFPFARGVYESAAFCLQAALFFTAVSDLFILILDYYLYGVLAFIVVQLWYGLRLEIISLSAPRQSEMCVNKADKVKAFIAYHFIKRILIQGFIAFILCLILRLAGVVPKALLIASVFYFVSIVSNVISAVRIALRKPGEKGNVIYAAGMLLFLLCDINVGLFNLSGFIAMPERAYAVMYSFSSILMWTFYAPSQVLIAISGREG